MEIVPPHARELAILEFLAESGKATLTAIVKKLGIDKTSAKRNITRLYNHGLVDKWYESGRIYYTLTRKGFEELKKLREAVKHAHA